MTFKSLSTNLTWRHNPEDSDLNLHGRENLKSLMTFMTHFEVPVSDN
jgi:hypothetical protein